MNPDELKEQLAEAIRNSNYEDATRIALDLIEQLEKTIVEKDAEIKRRRLANYWAHPAPRPGDSDYNLYQERKAEDSE